MTQSDLLRQGASTASAPVKADTTNRPMVNVSKGVRGFVSRPIMERLKEKISINPTTKCWEWIARNTAAGGYGRIWKGDRAILAHRLTYELFRGQIPIGMELDHVCRNKRCCNPNHVEAVFHSENMCRAEMRSHITHCKHGHKYNSVNTYRRSSGGKDCRQCRIRRVLDFTARRKAARAALAKAQPAAPERQPAATHRGERGES